MTRQRVEPARAGPGGVPLANRRLASLALVGILLLTFIVYLPSLGNGFTNWDDADYVTENPLVARPHVRDVLMTPVIGNYHPLTILSLALNYRISGYQPVSYHWLNLILHLANTGLVFAFVWMLSRRRFWTATATSLFFGIHPMHVESVAWIAERKDVLYTLFYLLGLMAYLRYLERRRWAWFALCLAALVLSLASKPAAVVFPLTLLALDTFFRRTDRLRLVLEKLPFLVLSIAAGLLTLKAQHELGAVASPGTWNLFEKLLFASYGSLMYVLKLFVPVGLSAVYPYPAKGIGPEFYGALVVMLVAFPALLFVCRRLRPLLFGWAFFFINILLVLQFVTVGQALMADRYTYVPYIGLLLGLTWWLDERPRPGKAGGPARLVIGAVLVVLLPLSLCQTWMRCGVWKNSETLWTDTIRKFPGRIVIAHNNLGLALADQGRYEEAIPRYCEAIRLKDNSGKVHSNLGLALAAQGKLDEAIFQYREAIRLDPNYSAAHNNLGIVLAAQDKLEEAIAHYREAIRLKDNYGETHNNLGVALAAQGKLEEAISHYREAIRLKDNYGEAHNNLGIALETQGKFEEAIAHYREAIRLRANYAKAHSNLGLALAAQGKFDEAVAEGMEWMRQQPQNPEAATVLAAALARKGDVEGAIRRYGNPSLFGAAYAEAYVSAGDQKRRLGNAGEAAAAYRRALELDPGSAGARRGLDALGGVTPGGR
jgi:Flp pilus assembly protein TadD